MNITTYKQFQIFFCDLVAGVGGDNEKEGGRYQDGTKVYIEVL